MFRKIALTSVLALGTTFAFASVLALSVTTAAADPALPSRHASAPVTYADLDLSRPGDLKQLAGRIAAAAKSVCETVNDDEAQVQAQRDVRDCMAATIAAATVRIERRIGSAMRTAVAANQASLPVRDAR